MTFKITAIPFFFIRFRAAFGSPLLGVTDRQTIENNGVTDRQTIGYNGVTDRQTIGYNGVTDKQTIGLCNL